MVHQLLTPKVIITVGVKQNNKIWANYSEMIRNKKFEIRNHFHISAQILHLPKANFQYIRDSK